MIVPLGLCECGCGSLANISPLLNRKNGYARGVPYRFLAGHRARLKSRTDPADLARKHNYGMETGQYDAMFEAQNGCCYICGNERKLAVDHDHATRIVRKLLCYSCNSRLSGVENAAWLDAAHAYLEEHS